MRNHYDVLIVGGGLAGNCLGLALQKANLKIAIVEAQTPEQQYQSAAGDRALALAAGTVTMLDALGIWQDVKHKATAIKDIHISDRGHFGKTRLSAEKERVSALGYVIIARDLETHIVKRVDQFGISRISPARIAGLIPTDSDMGVTIQHNDESIALSAQLVVGADGGQSTVRKLLDIQQQVTEYGQTALVTKVNCTLPHNNTAFERFTSSGPLALLPIGTHQCAVVWARKHVDAELFQSASDEAFIAQLQECFGYRLGALSLAAPRRSFPLTLVRAQQMVKGRGVIIGNAVHQLHPVAGQGFNLGLRDVVQLAEVLLHQAEQGKDLGAAELLQKYAKSRNKDLNQVVDFTDHLVRIYSNDWLALAAVRNLGLALLDLIPLGKTLLTKRAMGLAGRLPRVGIRR